MQQVLASTQTTGGGFQGTGGDMLLLVQQGSTVRNIVPQFRVPGSDPAVWVSLAAFSDPNGAGHQVIVSSPEVEYRLNPAAAGPNVWLVEGGYRRNV